MTLGLHLLVDALILALRRRADVTILGRRLLLVDAGVPLHHRPAVVRTRARRHPSAATTRSLPLQGDDATRAPHLLVLAPRVAHLLHTLAPRLLHPGGRGMIATLLPHLLAVATPLHPRGNAVTLTLTRQRVA